MPAYEFAGRFPQDETLTQKIRELQELERQQTLVHNNDVASIEQICAIDERVGRAYAEIEAYLDSLSL